ncbi:sulfurtransferase complex subunit TusC [Chromatium okenii]|jgi:tRNA 2-thiouridine synthesizing protein C|uniref:Sulfurtransferase complex subunit TusC n=1 Tax=Chromatium okenii TaxID=61644 RepID=A0A2S7XTG9_9GAMM|nr:sulfurtransferase complex subunit TusC [Chromatium okenii]MBK1642493.1 sulfurtransferase complex subunit TusC [Chromatium okenii]MBV5310550.1 sulfurtransferase complex subunit TusC [Chromatium okenii]PQJ97027.1 sulfurtransferase complex subunit TusC [Chromatium okenii]
MSEIVKKFMYVNRKAPYGTIYAWEALEVVLVGAAFDQDVSVMFIDDGVYQLAKGQDTKAVGMKNFSPTYRTLGDYEVKKVYVDQASLEARGLTQDDLVEIAWEDMETEEEVDNIVEVITSERVSALMNESDVIFSF